MQLITSLIDLFLHLDKHLGAWITQFGAWTYLLIFLVIFVETGVVIFPFLPGDSLLFAAGSLAALNNNVSLNVFILYPVLASAAVIGDNTNYWIGTYVGPRAFTDKVRFLKKEYLDRTHRFFERFGVWAILMGRMLPVVRTFIALPAGIAKMDRTRFHIYTFIGSLPWCLGLAWLGFFLGEVLRQFAPVATAYGDPSFAELCLEERRRLHVNGHVVSVGGPILTAPGVVDQPARQPRLGAVARRVGAGRPRPARLQCAAHEQGRVRSRVRGAALPDGRPQDHAADRAERGGQVPGLVA